MSKKKKDVLPVLSPDGTVQQVIRVLSTLQYRGQRPERIFETWITLAEHALRMLPAHLAAAVATKQFAEDPDETKAVWARAREEYEPEGMQRFGEAFALLMNSSVDAETGAPVWGDVIGDVYMQWVTGNEYQGQFFTPWIVCQFMAQLTMSGDPAAEVRRRVLAAAKDDPVLQLFAAMGLAGAPELRGLEHLAAVMPRLPAFRPVTVLDPACGSGRMLLATAAVYPYWMVASGLVQFMGQDIDRLCVQMARVNSLLYGLRGGTRHGDSLDVRAADQPTEPVVVTAAPPARRRSKRPVREQFELFS